MEEEIENDKLPDYTHKNDLPRIKLCVERGADINVQTAEFTPLIIAIINQQTDIVDYFLSHEKNDINACNLLNESPLLVACQMEQWTLVDKLLKKPEINLHQHACLYGTPLVYCLYNEHNDIANKLISVEKTRLKKLNITHHLGALYVAIITENLSVVNEIIKDNPAVVNQPLLNDLCTPPGYALSYVSEAIYPTFDEDIASQNDYPLGLALSIGNNKIFRCLLDNGASPTQRFRNQASVKKRIESTEAINSEIKQTFDTYLKKSSKKHDTLSSGLTFFAQNQNNNDVKSKVNPYYEKALYFARRGEFRYFESCFERLDDIDQVDKNGRSLLHHAMRLLGGSKYINKLLDLDANAQLEDVNQQTPLLYSVSQNFCILKNIECFLDKVNDASQLNVQDQMGDALYHAIRLNHVALVELLIMKNANPKAQQTDGLTNEERGRKFSSVYCQRLFSKQFYEKISQQIYLTHSLLEDYFDALFSHSKSDLVAKACCLFLNKSALSTQFAKDLISDLKDEKVLHVQLKIFVDIFYQHSSSCYVEAVKKNASLGSVFSEVEILEYAGELIKRFAKHFLNTKLKQSEKDELLITFNRSLLSPLSGPVSIQLPESDEKKTLKILLNEKLQKAKIASGSEKLFQWLECVRLCEAVGNDKQLQVLKKKVSSYYEQSASKQHNLFIKHSDAKKALEYSPTSISALLTLTNTVIRLRNKNFKPYVLQAAKGVVTDKEFYDLKALRTYLKSQQNGKHIIEHSN